MLHHGLYRLHRWLPVLLLAVLTPLALHAEDSGDQVHFGKSIVVNKDETAGNLVCIGCSIRVQGTSSDVVAIGGNVEVSGAAKGDVVAVGGSISLGENASVLGDVATIGGHLSRHPDAIVKGSVTSQTGILVLLALVFIPLLPVVLIVALIVWLVTRNRPLVPKRA